MPNNIRQQALFIQSGDPATENRVPDSYSTGQMGQRITLQDATDATKARTYQFITVDSSMSVAPADGLVAYWRNATGYVVTTQQSNTGRNQVAGVFRTAVLVTNVGFVQQEGPLTSLTFINPPTALPSGAGLAVIPSATDGQVDCLAAGTAPTYLQIGRTTGQLVPGTNTAPVQLEIPGRD